MYLDTHERHSVVGANFVLDMDLDTHERHSVVGANFVFALFPITRSESLRSQVKSLSWRDSGG
jgi:hypothetical protein